MTLAESLGVQAGEMVSLIGAGGKTTTLFRLAKELREKGGKVLVTTTTKIFKPNKPHVERLFLVQDVNALIAESRKIPRPAVIGAGYGVDDEGKLVGLPAPWLDEIKESAVFDTIIVEADGAASRLFKIPSELEPVVPTLSGLVVWSMAIKIIGKPLDASSVHRAERAVALLGVSPGTILTQEHIVKLLADRDGCLKGIPAASRKVALINQADSPEEIKAAQKLAGALLPLGFERALITSFLSDEAVKKRNLKSYPLRNLTMISAVVLAAGKGERMGQPKLFLPWRDKAVLQWVLESVLASAVSEVICVARDLAAVRAHISVTDERLSWLVNDQPEGGQSSSVIAGLWAVDARSDGALFVVGDQPMLNSALIDALIDRSERVSAPIVAPSFQGEMRNPALFRRPLFPELLKLKGDHGGRSVIKEHRDRVELVQWHEEAPFMDIDDQRITRG